MNKVKSLYLATLVICCVLNACITNMPIEIEDRELVVVNCILTADSVQKLSLTYSAQVGDYTFDEVKTAQVELYENDSLIGLFEKVSYATWELNYCPQKGKEYHLVVNLDNGTKVEASTQMPDNNTIAPVADDYTTHSFRQLSAKYPMWIFTLGHTPGVAEIVYDYPSKEFSLRDCYTNHPLADDFNQEGANSDSLFDYFYYARCWNLENNDSLPVNFSCEGSAEFIFFRTVSFEYDQYLKSSVQKMKIREVEDDPVIWFDESKVYSNIENGIGIFGAYTDHYFYYLWLNLVYENRDGKVIMH